MKKILSMILCAVMFAGLVTVPVSAAEPESSQPALLDRILYEIADAAIRGIAWTVGALIPGRDLPREHDGANFLPGMDAFLDAPAGNAGWKLGYARATLIPPGYFDPVTKQYTGPPDVFVAGGLTGDGQRLLIDRKTPTDLLDDMAVRVTALSDGSGRGTVVFASLDTYALTTTDVRIIRSLLEDYAKANNIISINIASMHQHSVIDTLGMNAMLLGGLFINPWNNLFGIFRHHGKNPRYMDFLHNTTADAIKAAVEAMEPGRLYYGYADATDFINDKRAPYVFDNEIHRFRFVPSDKNSRETWFVNYGVHTVGLGASPRTITGDYPFYMEERVNSEANANFQMVQSAISAISRNDAGIYVPGGPARTREEAMAAYGHAVGDLLIGISGETAVAPMLNIRHIEYRMPVDNPLHMLLFRIGMIEAVGVRRHLIGPDIDVITETAYMELGQNLAVVFAPGEVDPVLLFGGARPASQAYRGVDFIFTPLRDMVRGERKTLMFGLMNDHSGYYEVPNDIQHFVLFGNEEINQSSTQSAVSLLVAFEKLTDSVK